MERRVLKIWKDDIPQSRPKEIVIQLLKDGVIYDTVTLNAVNNWRYTWEKLPAYNKDGSKIVDEIAVADAHPLGARPFGRADYINKFRTLAAGKVSEREIDRFIAAAENVEKLEAGELGQLNILSDVEPLDSPKGLF